MKRIMTVFGTRPEAIKVAPIIKALESSSSFESIAVSTGQHREMLDQVTKLFSIQPDLDLNIIQQRQTLIDISVNALKGVTAAIEQFKPDGVIVQGDTSTSTFAALAAFYARVPVFHVEAGLRTGDIYSPFPEEANRKMTTQIAALHLAPTSTSKANLLAEGVEEGQIVITGNSVIDALHQVVQREHTFEDPALKVLMDLDKGKPLLLVTAHRRENLDGAMSRIGRAVASIARRYPDLRVVLPLHKNPIVREAIMPEIAGQTNVITTEPLSYLDFVHTMKAASIVLTDSGGVQEEAPSLSKPVLVMRDTTERPEAVVAGTVKLIGTEEEAIVSHVAKLLDDSAYYASMAEAANPYGDGRAAKRTLAAIRHYFGYGCPPQDFAGDNVAPSS